MKGRYRGKPPPTERAALGDIGTREYLAALQDVLGVMGRPGRELQPTLDAIAEHAARLCGADTAVVFLVEGKDLSRVALAGDADPDRVALSQPRDGPALVSRALREGRPIHVPDVLADPITSRSFKKDVSHRSRVAVPILLDGTPLGAIHVARRDPIAFTEGEIRLLVSFARQAAIAIENVRLFNETKEALERQTAISEILRVIAGSPTDVQPVLDAIAGSAARFCGAENVDVILQHEDGLLHPSAHVGMLGSSVPPFSLSRETVTGRSMIEGRPVHVDDLQEEGSEYPLGSEQARAMGHRTTLATPLLRGGTAFGAILLRRADRRPFTGKQVDLVRTFADQAVIAIENVRLFNETKEALAQQTATAEVLKTISRSAFDLGKVLETVVENAARLTAADVAWIAHLDGEVLRVGARYGRTPEILEQFNRRAPAPVGAPMTIGSKRSPIVTATQEARTIRIDDASSEDLVAPGISAAGGRSVVFVPLIRDGRSIGALAVARQVVRPFSDREVEIIQTFADQAAIAMENVRLFNETKEALEQQTAVARVLQSMSRSAFDLGPILETLVEQAARLCDAERGSIHQLDGDVYRTTAFWGDISEEYKRLALDTVRRPGRETLIGRTALERAVVHIPDVLADPEYTARDIQRVGGYRTMLGVPLLRDSVPIGVFVLTRQELRPFADRQIELVRTFADQAVIAIENVRLFNETKEALEQQTAISDVLAAISGSVFDLDAVLRTISERAVALCRADSCTAYRVVDNDRMVLVVRAGPLSGSPYQLGDIMDRNSPMLAAVATRTMRTHQVEDAQGHPELPQSSLRARLAVPIIRDGAAIGSLLLGRFEPRGFTPREVQLVHTFAQQAGIAMENVRLFNETKEALEQQTAVSEVLKSISRTAFDLPAVLGTIAERAVALSGAESALIMRRDGDELVSLAHHGAVLGGLTTQGRRVPISEGTLVGRAVLRDRTHVVADARSHPELPQEGPPSRLVVPIRRGGVAIGVIALSCSVPRQYSDREIAVIETFADQASIAIENVRLFNETKEALEQQTATSEVLQSISRSAFDLQSVLDTVVERAAQLCGAEQAWLRRIEGDEFRFAAYYGASPELRAMFEELRLDGAMAKIDQSGMGGRAVMERRPIHVHDIAEDEALREASLAKRGGGRTALAVPMLRDGEPMGAIVVARNRVAPFNEREIRLVETFADQAVIAIENVRLFNEIQDTSRQLETAGRHKSEFLANMSHELRTPLNAIIGFSEVLLQGMFGELNAKQREYQQDVLSSGRHLLSLINDILDLSKIEAGRVELELSEFSLPAALDNSVTMVRERASRHGIRLAIDCDGVDLIVADERKVKQIVANLLSNAVKFTPDGGSVEVRAVRADGEVRVAIRDTGIGIDEADRERIFQEFQQASRDPERSREGTGLGLALSKRYVELHGGRIWVESEVGQGSTFTFALPLRTQGAGS